MGRICTFFLLAPWVFLATAQNSTANNTSCYYNSGDTLEPQPLSKWVPCPNSQREPGGFQSCCFVGSECGQGNICHFSDLTPDQEGKEWFLGGCTDPTGKDASCPQNCGDYQKTDIQYSNSTQQWSCCGDNICNGTYVTGESFTDTAPDQWSATYTVPVPGATSTPDPSSSLGSTTPTATPSSHPHHSGLSGGAIAGIVIGSIAGAAAVMGAVIFLLWKGKKHGRQSSLPAEAGDNHIAEMGGLHSTAEMSGDAKAEMDAESPAVEMSTKQRPGLFELPTRDSEK